VSADESEAPALIPNHVRRRSRGNQALELCVFLLMFLPSTVLSFFTAGQWKQGFVLTAITVILRDCALCSLAVYFVWQNRQPLSAIGWSTRYWPVHVAIGVTLFPVVVVGSIIVAWVFLSLGLSSADTTIRSSLSIHGWADVPLAVLLVAVVAIAEETIFRGYLLLRFREITGNMGLAVLLSTVIFTAGHGYEGGAGMATVSLLGLVFMALYLSTRSLIASIVLHFLFDLVGVVLVPLLKHR
jgi:uncharacterized protein